jgi:hypothetical protein
MDRPRKTAAKGGAEMSSSEKRIKEAFDSITMPEGLKESTLEVLEQRAQEQLGSTSEQTSQATSNSAHKTALPASERTASGSISAGGTIAKRAPRPFSRRLGFAMAACLVLCMLGFGGFSAYATETAVVDIEVNPAIELGVNRFDIVVDARALNEDANDLLEELSVIGKNYDEALTAITQSDAFQSYINEDSYVDISVICSDERQSESLVNRGQTQVNALPCAGACTRVSEETHQAAAEHGMGVSRYEAALVLVELDPTLSLEDCASMSMKELRSRIAALDPENDYADHSVGHQNGQGQGQGSGNQGQNNHENSSQNGQGQGSQQGGQQHGRQGR